MGGFLRFHALERQSVWDDEICTLKMISCSLPDSMIRFKTAESHPPLYFLQLRWWKHLFGNSLGTLRANSAFWGTLSLWLLFELARRWLSRGESVIFATLFMALAPYHVAYSQELRPYALAIFLGLAGFLVLDEIRRRPSNRWLYAGQALLFTAQLYTHYWGSFAVLAQFVTGLIVLTDVRARWKWIGAAAVSGLCFLAWVPTLLLQVKFASEIMNFWIDPPSFLNLARTFTGFCNLGFRFASSQFILTHSSAINIVLGSLFFIGLLVGLWKGPLPARLWLTVGCGVPFIVSFWKPTIYVWYRYPVILFPAFVLLTTAGFEKLFSKKRALFFIHAVIAVAFIWGDWIYFTAWEKANPRAVVTYVDSLATPETVVVRPAYFADLFAMYNKSDASVVDSHTLDSVDKRAAFRGKPVILLAFDVPADPITDAFLSERKGTSSRYFPGTAHLGITVYTLEQ
jgi:uncharacterized membrane protein